VDIYLKFYSATVLNGKLGWTGQMEKKAETKSPLIIAKMGLGGIIIILLYYRFQAI
jgi:hypothetical protein